MGEFVQDMDAAAKVEEEYSLSEIAEFELQWNSDPKAKKTLMLSEFIAKQAGAPKSSPQEQADVAEYMFGENLGGTNGK